MKKSYIVAILLFWNYIKVWPSKLKMLDFQNYIDIFFLFFFCYTFYFSHFSHMHFNKLFFSNKEKKLMKLFYPNIKIIYIYIIKIPLETWQGGIVTWSSRTIWDQALEIHLSIGVRESVNFYIIWENINKCSYSWN